MAYQPQFQKLVAAIESFAIFPEAIIEFTKLLRQRYERKHSPKDLVWIDELCGTYYDNCLHYVEFIERVVAVQFLAKCLNLPNDSERKRIIKELKANIGGAKGRLGKFLAESSEDQVVNKVNDVLSEMEAVQQQKDEKVKYFRKFGEWLKGKAGDLEKGGNVFAKFVGPLWDILYENAAIVFKGEYDHEALKKAVENIIKNVPKMEDSIEKNTRALEGLDSVMDVMERETPEQLETQMRDLYPVKDDVIHACQDVTKKLRDSKNE